MSTPKIILAQQIAALGPVHSNQIGAANIPHSMTVTTGAVPGQFGGGVAGQYGVLGSMHVSSIQSVSDGILTMFRKENLELYDYVMATAQLLGASVHATWSPHQRLIHTAVRRKNGIVWQLFNHNWMVEVQWMASYEGGDEADWIKHFGSLADMIAEARASGAPQHGDEPPITTLQQAAYANQQAMGQQMAKHQQQQYANQWNQNSYANQANSYGRPQNSFGNVQVSTAAATAAAASLLFEGKI
jgi:hypothetical protein